MTSPLAPTPEAVVQPSFLVDRERRRLLGVERAQALPTPTDPLERDVLADHRDDVRRLTDVNDVVVGDTHRQCAPAASERYDECIRGTVAAGYDSVTVPPNSPILQASRLTPPASPSTARAAANRAIGTRNGEHDT